MGRLIAFILLLVFALSAFVPETVLSQGNKAPHGFALTTQKIIQSSPIFTAEWAP